MWYYTNLFTLNIGYNNLLCRFKITCHNIISNRVNCYQCTSVNLSICVFISVHQLHLVFCVLISMHLHVHVSSFSLLYQSIMFVLQESCKVQGRGGGERLMLLFEKCLLFLKKKGSDGYTYKGHILVSHVIDT